MHCNSIAPGDTRYLIPVPGTPVQSTSYLVLAPPTHTIFSPVHALYVHHPKFAIAFTTTKNGSIGGRIKCQYWHITINSLSAQNLVKLYGGPGRSVSDFACAHVSKFHGREVIGRSANHRYSLPSKYRYHFYLFIQRIPLHIDIWQYCLILNASFHPMISLPMYKHIFKYW